MSSLISLPFLLSDVSLTFLICIAKIYQYLMYSVMTYVFLVVSINQPFQSISRYSVLFIGLLYNAYFPFFKGFSRTTSIFSYRWNFSSLIKCLLHLINSSYTYLGNFSCLINCFSISKILQSICKLCLCQFHRAIYNSLM